MLTRYCLELTPDRPCSSRPEWAYRLYAALLERAPAEFGALVHEMRVSPISHYLDRSNGRFYWNVTLLGEETEHALGALLEGTSQFYLEKDRVQLRAALKKRGSIASPDDIFRLAAAGTGRHILNFRTATAFKSRGRYQILVTERLILQSLIQKWNGCFPGCPIENEDGAGMDTISCGLQCRRLQLRDQTYFLKGNAIPGFVGTLTLDNRLSGFHRLLADALLHFAGYAGIGIKTSLGMGGVEHHTE